MLNDPYSDGDVDVFGVAIKATRGEQDHIGVLCAVGAPTTYLCHLAWHLQVRCEPFDSSYHWRTVELPPLSRRLAARYFYKVASSPSNLARIPYGFDFETELFDEATADYRTQPDGKGLTCATFVLSVLGTLGISILDTTSFAGLPDDDDWRKEMIDLLRRLKAPENHCSALEQSPRTARIRPEHVAAGLVSADTPLDASQFVPRGAKIHADIRS